MRKSNVVILTLETAGSFCVLAVVSIFVGRIFQPWMLPAPHWAYLTCGRYFLAPLTRIKEGTFGAPRQENTKEFREGATSLLSRAAGGALSPIR